MDPEEEMWGLAEAENDGGFVFVLWFFMVVLWVSNGFLLGFHGFLTGLITYSGVCYRLQLQFLVVLTLIFSKQCIVGLSRGKQRLAVIKTVRAWL